jgi:hypothetical protein
LPSVSSILTIFSALLGLTAAGFSVFLAIQNHARMPFFDLWGFFIEVAHHNGSFPSHLWLAEHAEHRTFIPKLFINADYRWFAATGWLLTACELLLQLGQACLWIWLVKRHVSSRERHASNRERHASNRERHASNRERHVSNRERHVSNREWWPFVGLSLACAFVPSQIENFLFGMNINFNIPAFCGLLALVFYARGRWLFTAIAAWLATYSLVSYILVWPLFIGISAYRRRWKEAGLWTLVGLSVIAFYLYGHSHFFGDKIRPAVSIADLLIYWVSYLGAPASVFGMKSAGLVGALIVGIAFWQLWQLRKLDSLLSTVCVGIIVWSLLAALATSYGRAPLGLELANSSRYQTTVQLLYAALLSASFAGDRAQQSRRLWPKLAFSAVALTIAIPTLKIEAATGAGLDLSATLQRAELSQMVGVEDRDALEKNLVYQPLLVRPWQFLRENQLSVFADPRLQNLGKKFALPLNDNCPQTVTSTVIRDVAKPGIFLQGEVNKADQWWLLDEQSNVVGFGEKQRRDPRQFYAYARWNDGDGKHRQPQTLRLVGQQGDRACVIRPMRTPAISKMFRASMLDGSRWEIDGNGDINFGPKHDFILDLPNRLQVVRVEYQGQPRIAFFDRGTWIVDLNQNLQPDGSDARIETDQDGIAVSLRTRRGWRVAVFQAGIWLLDEDGDFRFDRKVSFGQAEDLPVVGDWAQLGHQCLGVYRSGQWLLDSNCDERWNLKDDQLVQFGQPGDWPIVADWDGFGRERLGLVSKGMWKLDLDGNHQWEFPADHLSAFGSPTGQPVLMPPSP